MPTPAPSGGSFRFGPFVFDPRSGDLSGNGIACRLSDQPLALLTALLEQPERLVTREELRQRLWPNGTFVDFDHGLNSAVSRLREALQDSAGSPRFVQTIPRRGYRLLVPVEVDGVDVAATAKPEESSRSDVDLSKSGASGASRRSWRLFWTVGAAAVLIGAIAWRATGIRRDPRSAPVRLLTVTSFPGSEGGPPSLSPDGNFVVFNWSGPDFSTNGDLWVKAIDGDALRRLTDTPEFNEVFPAWSPDGRQIAFTPSDGTRSGVHLISALGGPERKVTDSGWGATWLPDSASFVFFDGAAGSLALFHYVLATGERRQLTTPLAGFIDRDPEVSPDGKTVAFVRTTRGQWFGGASRAALFVVPIAGGEPVRLDDWVGRVSGPEWTPDGREILYLRSDPSGLRAFRIALGGGPAVLAAGLPSSAYQLATSKFRANGTFRVAVVDARSDVGIRLVNLQDGQSKGRTLTWTTFCDSTRLDWPGRFSRDGTKVTFTSDRTGTAQIYVANRDGSHLRTVTTFEGNSVGLPSWSPDGRFLVFDAVDGQSLNDLYVVGSDGGPLRRLTHDDKPEANPEWSADGQWIYYESQASGRPEIWKISAAGGQPVGLTTQGGMDPRASSDGRSIYFLEPSSGSRTWKATNLKRMNLDGTNITTVLSDILMGRWDVADDGIVFLTGPAGLTPDPEKPDAVEIYSFADHRTRRLGELPFPVVNRGYSPPRVLAVAPDGRSVAVAHMDNWTRDIIVADNFR